MNILFVCDYFPPYNLGGAEISAYNLAIGLSRRGHEVSILTGSQESSKYTFDEFRNVYPVVYYKAHIPFRKYLHTGILASRILAERLKELTDTEDFDIIHAHNWISAYSFKRNKKSGKNLPPSLLSIRDYRYLCPNIFGWCFPEHPTTHCSLYGSAKCIYRHSKIHALVRSALLFPYASFRYASCYILRQSLFAFDALLTNSDYLKSIYLNNISEIAPSMDMYTLYNPVDVENLKPDYSQKRVKNILYVGRLGPEKGLEYLIDAIPQVVKENRDCHFTIVGDGVDRKKLESRAANLGMQEFITFEGYVPYSKLNEYYQISDIVVLPSIWPEPFGRVLIEAMVAGKPVVATNIGGIPEIVQHNKTGLLVTPMSTREIAKAIIRLLEDETLRIGLGKIGRKTAEKRFDRDVIAKKALKIYSEVV